MENGTSLREAGEAQEASDAALKERSKQLVQQSRDELRVEQSSRTRQGQLLGLLIEKGIVEHTTHSDLELTGYCRLKPELGGGLHQVQYELLKNSRVEASYAQVKGILIEKGILYNIDDGSLEQLDRELDDFAKRRLGRLDPIIPSHIVRMTNYINEFTENLQARPGDTEWEKFRSCIRQVHEFHLKNLSMQQGMREDAFSQPTTRDALALKVDLAQVKLDIDNMLQPLNKLALQSQKLFSSIETIESKICQLDRRVEQFHERFNANLFRREKSFEDMLALSTMRERIGRKLAVIEAEIHESKKLLLQGQSLEK